MSLAQPSKRGVTASGAARSMREAPRPASSFSVTERNKPIHFGATLRVRGYDVDAVDNDAKAERCLRDTAPDVMVLDLASPDASAGLARLRGFASRLLIPIIALVAEESAGLRGLFAGADDFVITPVSSIHLIARVQSLLRRTKSGNLNPVVRPDLGPLLRIKDVELDLETHRVTRGGRDVLLGPTQYRI